MDNFNNVFGSLINEIWLTYDTQNKGYLNKSECRDLLESLSKSIPQLNFNFDEFR